MSKYLQQEINELVDSIVSPLKDFLSGITAADEISTAAADTKEQLESGGVASLSLGTLAAVSAVGSLVVDASGNKAAGATMNAVGRQLAGINVLYELLDSEFDWDDVAALSTAIGTNLLAYSSANPLTANPLTKVAGGLFLLYGETIPFWNWIGSTYGSKFLQNWDPLGLYDDIHLNYNQSKNWAPPRRDPLALDLD